MLRFVSNASTGIEPHSGSIDQNGAQSAAPPQIARIDWLVLFAAFDGAPEGLDPVRLQQGLFLFSRCPGVPLPSKYVFEPVTFGPASSELNQDLYRLAGGRLLQPVPVRGMRWCLYKPIDTTFERANGILRRPEADDLEDAIRRLAEIKLYVSSVGFGELLERIYSEYPECAVNSVFHSAA